MHPPDDDPPEPGPPSEPDHDIRPRAPSNRLQHVAFSPGALRQIVLAPPEERIRLLKPLTVREHVDCAKKLRFRVNRLCQLTQCCVCARFRVDIKFIRFDYLRSRKHFLEPLHDHAHRYQGLALVAGLCCNDDTAFDRVPVCLDCRKWFTHHPQVAPPWSLAVIDPGILPKLPALTWVERALLATGRAKRRLLFVHGNVVSGLVGNVCILGAAGPDEVAAAITRIPRELTLLVVLCGVDYRLDRCKTLIARREVVQQHCEFYKQNRGWMVDAEVLARVPVEGVPEGVRMIKLGTELAAEAPMGTTHNANMEIINMATAPAVVPPKDDLNQISADLLVSGSSAECVADDAIGTISAYPDLFPWGKGGPEGVDMLVWLCTLVMRGPPYSSVSTFLCDMMNIALRRAWWRSACLRVKIQPATAAALQLVRPEDVHAVLNALMHPKQPHHFTAAAQALFGALRLTARHVPGSMQNNSETRQKLFALLAVVQPAIYFTINLGDDLSLDLRHLMESFVARGIPWSDDRGCRALAVAVYYEAVMKAFLEIAVGYYEFLEQRPGCRPIYRPRLISDFKGGYFGSKVAALAYVTETTGRYILHTHGLIALLGLTADVLQAGVMQEGECWKQIYDGILAFADSIVATDVDETHEMAHALDEEDFFKFQRKYKMAHPYLAEEEQFAKMELPTEISEEELKRKFLRWITPLVIWRQRHSHTARCTCDGDCVFGFPREVRAQTSLTKDDGLRLKQSHESVNHYHPGLLGGFGGNIDMQIIGANRGSCTVQNLVLWAALVAFYQATYVSKQDDIKYKKDLRFIASEIAQRVGGAKIARLITLTNQNRVFPATVMAYLLRGNPMAFFSYDVIALAWRTWFEHEGDRGSVSLGRHAIGTSMVEDYKHRATDLEDLSALLYNMLFQKLPLAGRRGEDGDCNGGHCFGGSHAQAKTHAMFPRVRLCAPVFHFAPRRGDPNFLLWVRYFFVPWRATADCNPTEPFPGVDMCNVVPILQDPNHVINAQMDSLLHLGDLEMRILLNVIRTNEIVKAADAGTRPDVPADDGAPPAQEERRPYEEQAVASLGVPVARHGRFSIAVPTLCDLPKLTRGTRIQRGCGNPVGGPAAVVVQNAHPADMGSVQFAGLDEVQTGLARRILFATLNPHQGGMRLMILGAGGTGKSQIIKSVSQYLVNNGWGHRILLMSFTGVAAMLLEQEGCVSGTTSTLLHIGRCGAATSAEAICDLRKEHSGVVTYVVDECSFLATIHWLAMLTQMAHIAEDTKFNVVLFGDFLQLPPVVPPALYKDWSTSPRLHFKDFEITQLLKVYRLIDEDCRLMQVQRALRDGALQPEQLMWINSRSLGAVGMPSSLAELRNAKVICQRHDVINALTNELVLRAAREAGQQLFIWHAADGQARYRASNASEDRSRAQAIGYYYFGMRATAIKTVSEHWYIVNNASILLVGIRLHPDEPVVDAAAPVVELKYVPRFVLVQTRRHDRYSADVLPGQVPLHPETFTARRDRRSVVPRTQLPYVPDVAITHFAAQGAEFLCPLVLDLVRPEFGLYVLAVVYVMITRCRDPNLLYLLRPLFSPGEMEAEIPALLYYLYPSQDLLAFYYDLDNPNSSTMDRQLYLRRCMRRRQELLDAKTRAQRAFKCAGCKRRRVRFVQACPGCKAAYPTP